MASIKMSDLYPSESHLLVGLEKFLDELSDSDLATIKGGKVRHDLLFLLTLPLPISASLISTTLTSIRVY
jgi:hypothetical protein